MEIIKNKLALNLFKFILVPILLISFIYFTLNKGIKINSLDLDIVKIEQLYIKLDKKIIFSAKKIQINAKKQAQKLSTIDELSATMKELKYFYMFFQSFSIDELRYEDYSAKISFQRNKFYLDNSDFTLLMSINEKNSIIYMNVLNFYSKRYMISSKAKLFLNLKTKLFAVKGSLDGEFLSMDYKMLLNGSLLEYKLSNIHTNNLGEILSAVDKYYKLPPHLQEWVGGKVVAKNYFISELNGKVDTNDMNFYLDDIEAKGYVKDLSVVLDKGIPAITSPLTALSFKNQRLSFAYNKLDYEGYDLKNSKLYIYKMLSDKAGIFINIKANARLDAKIKKILNNYKINIPINQQKGLVYSDVVLKFPFEFPDQISYHGNFVLKNVVFNDLLVKHALMKLVKNKLLVSKADLNHKFFSLANLSIELNLAKKTGEADANLARLSLPKNALLMQNQKVKAKLSFKQGFKIYLEQYQLGLDFDKGFKVQLKQLAKLVKYSKMAKDYGIKAGEFDLYSKEFKNFDISLKDAFITTPFLNLDYTPYDKDSFLIQLTPKTTSLNTASGKLLLRNDHFYIKDLIYINTVGKKSSSDMELSGKNIKIFLKDMNKTLPFKTLEYSKKKGEAKLEASFLDTKFRLYESKSKFQLSFKNINDSYLNTFLQKKIFDGGNFNISLSGLNQDFFTGKMLIKNTTVKGMKLLRRLVSFFDTIPSLLLFKTSSFNENGYKIEYGYVDFKRAKDIMLLNEINLQGESIDIVGTGSINLRNKNLNIKLELKTMKSASSIISSIPLINKILLGNKEQISTTVYIKGKVSDPVITTDLASDAAKLPVNIIKNIIELPKNLLSQ